MLADLSKDYTPSMKL